MTTPEAILLTQLPIAVACFWVAYEIRRLRRTLERVTVGPPAEQDPATPAQRGRAASP
ncbi:MAG: hypothetical protein FJ087_02760 [Deltaproteobacteria bacterium]|nr:hypothetical protein [Deltaproteobacteria bacterium]